MCGINGAYCIEPLPAESFSSSLQSLRHRGPDSDGVFHQGQAFLGIRRLAIIDLVGGQQPIPNETGSIMVVMNGEIYNYRELMADLRARGHTFATQSDTEVLVHLYEEHGTAMCQFLRGMFAFAIWDEPRQALFVARDRFGKKPLYYTRTASGGLLFASELKALRLLARATGGTWSIRPQSIYDYLSLGVVPQPATIYDDVWALPPGSWMRLVGGELCIEEYWSLDYLPKLRLSYDEAMAHARTLIADAVRLRLRSDVPLGVFLSGGVDSAIVAYEAARHLGGDLCCYTVAMGEAAFDESPVAARIARHLGVQHRILPLALHPRALLEEVVTHYDQPFADSSAIPTLAISRLARQYVTVILNGDGGDEVFAGYRRYLAAWRSRQFSWVPGPVADTAARALERRTAERRTLTGFAARFARGLAAPPGSRYLTWTTDMLQEADKADVWRGAPMRPTEAWLEAQMPHALTGVDLQRCMDVRVNLLSDLLVKMDMATMAASLEGRSPLLDHTVAEFAARLPGGYLLRGGSTKSLLRDAYAAALPPEVVRGPKRGFEIPLSSWLADELRPLLTEALGSRSARIRAYVSDEFVDALIDDSILQDRNRAYMLYAALVLELWLQKCA